MLQDLILSASQSVIEDMKSENEVLALDQARDFSSQIVDVKHHLSELVAQHAALSDRINRLVEVSTETRDEDKYQNAQKNGDFDANQIQDNIQQAKDRMHHKDDHTPSDFSNTISYGLDTSSWGDSLVIRRSFAGILSGVLHGANGLRPKLIGTRDPYATIRIRDQNCRTAALISTQNPKWEMPFSFILLVRRCVFLHET